MKSATGRWVLSGGLASGKSAVAGILEGRPGVLVIDADAMGHKVLGPGGPAFDAVAAAWPEVVSGGQIQRAALAAIVFAKEAELARLESITHPHIFGMIRDRVEGFDGVVVVEAPVVEHTLGEGWGRIVVDCDEETQLSRAIERGMDTEDALARIRSQPSREEWLALADIVVPNHGSLDDLEEAVGRLAAVL